jgi:hypothetical protein
MRAQTPINGRCRFPLHRHDHNASNAEFIHRARKISVAQKSVQKFAANPRGYFLMVMRAPHVGHISDRPGNFDYELTRSLEKKFRIRPEIISN